MANINLMQFMQMVRSGGNPQQMVINMLQGGAQNNPMMQNLLNLAQNGNSAGIEEFARNMCKSKGIDYDQEFNKFKQQMGIK